MRPPHAILEYTPGIAERHQWSLLLQYPASLEALHGAGYHMYHLGGLGIHAHSHKPTHPLACFQRKRTLPGCAWRDMPLPALRKVTPAALRAEARNALNMVASIRRKTFHVPWDLHPRSLHAEFTHNTNVLAVHRDAAAVDVASGARVAVPSAGEVGVAADTFWGLGGSICKDIMRDSD